MRFRKIFTYSVLLFLFPFVSFAGNTLTGRITDKNGEPLAGAVVEITDLKVGAAADTNGIFHLAELPKGTFSVEVHLIGFATATESVVILGDTRKDFILSDNIIERNEVVVTGASLATGERRSITPIQSLSLKQLHENASTNVIDAITSLPGVTALSTGPAISKPVIRGLGYNRIITLNDGVRQEGQQWGDEHGIEIDDYNVTRVEVLKGPASLAFGSDALAGVINIISNPEYPEGSIKGNITGNFQTNSGLAAGHADLGGMKNGISWNAYVTEKAAHDYHNAYDGYVFNSRFQNTNYGASMGINKKWGSSKLYFTAFNQHLGLVEGDRDSATGKFTYTDRDNMTVIASDANSKSYKMNTPYQHIQHYKWVLDNSIYLDNGGRVSMTLGYQCNIREEFSDAATPQIPGLSLLLQTATYDLKYFLPQKKDWHISTGINGMSQWNANRGDEFLVPDYRLFDGGLYTMAKRDWDKWSVSGGLRLDVRYLSTYRKLEDEIFKQSSSTQSATITYQLFYPFSDYFVNGSGSIGAAYNIDKASIIKLNFSTGYRTPNIAELAANGVHEGTIRYEYGNVELKPENSAQLDLGYSWHSEHLLVNASIFDNYIVNFIYIRKMLGADGRDSVPTFNNSNGYNAFIQNQGTANLYGGEFNIDYHPHPLDWLHIENTFSYVRGKFVEKVEGTNNLPYMPPARWVFDLRAQKRTFGKRMKNVYAKAGVDMNFAQNNVFEAYGTETRAKGYTLIDAGVGADITDKKHHTLCTVTVSAQNIMDVAYQNSLSRLRYAPENYVTGRTGVYNVGRNFSAMVSVPLDIRK